VARVSLPMANLPDINAAQIGDVRLVARRHDVVAAVGGLE
jgi:hypothetical protein